MPDLDDELIEVLRAFLAETEDLLEQMDQSLLALEDNPDDRETLNALFRVAHTVKGTAGMFGMDAVVAFAHRMESVLDRLREGRLVLDVALGSLTQVPLTPRWIRGVINLRGAVVPVIDLHARFGDAVASVSKRSCIVIIEILHLGDRQDIGILVDAVSAVVEIADDEIQPAPAFGASVRTEFIQGMGRVDGRFVIILDIDRTFSIDEMAILSGVSGG